MVSSAGGCLLTRGLPALLALLSCGLAAATSFFAAADGGGGGDVDEGDVDEGDIDGGGGGGSEEGEEEMREPLPAKDTGGACCSCC